MFNMQTYYIHTAFTPEISNCLGQTKGGFDLEVNDNFLTSVPHTGTVNTASKHHNIQEQLIQSKFQDTLFF